MNFRKLSSKEITIVISAIIILVLSFSFGQKKIQRSSYLNDVERVVNDIYIELSTAIDEEKWNEDNYPQNVRAYEYANNLKVGLINAHGDLLNNQRYKLNILDSSGVVYTVYLDSLAESSIKIDKDLSIGEKITAYGYLWGNKFKNMTMTSLYINDQLVYDEPLQSDNKGVKITGSLLKSQRPDGVDSIYYQNVAVQKAFLDEIENMNYKKPSYNIEENEKVYIYEDPISLNDYYVKVFDVPTGDIIKQVMIMMPIPDTMLYSKVSFLEILLDVIVLIVIFLAMNYFYKKLEKDNNKIIHELQEKINILNKYNNNLDHQNQQLNRDIKKERDLDKVRIEFIRDVSHEIKTPLGVIRGFTEGIQDGLAEDDIDYYLDVILEELDKIDDLVKDMLELSKYQTSAYDLDLINFDIGVVVYDSVNRFKKDLEMRDLKIDFNDAHYMVKGDIRRIDQVIINFINNAIRYSDKGTTIKINLQESNEKVRFSIENICESFSEEQLGRIWDKFYKTDEARTKRFEGSGLGLSIVKEILQMHGEAFGVENTEFGVKFYFELPKNGE